MSLIIGDVLRHAKAVAYDSDYGIGLPAARHLIGQLIEVVGVFTSTETDFIQLPKEHAFSPAEAEARKRWAQEFVSKFSGAARGLGYGVFHGGTLVRDIDLVAVPWSSDAATPVDFVIECCHRLSLSMGNHGNTVFGHQWFALWDRAHRDHQIDLKVIDRAAEKRESAPGGNPA